MFAVIITRGCHGAQFLEGPGDPRVPIAATPIAWSSEGMRAVIATPNGASRTELRDGIDNPEPAPDEALVAVRAFAVNRGELTLVAMRDGWQPGQDVAGVVERAAADGSGPPAGTRVAGLAEWHGWAEYVGVPTNRIAMLPDGVSDVQAAALPMAGTTAVGVLEAGGPLLGANVLVTGASGGVGRYAVQLATIGGAKVTAVARAERADELRALGAVDVVAATADAPSTAFDLILESEGGASLEAAVAKAAPDGTIVVFGNSSREPSRIGFLEFAQQGAHGARIASYFSFQHAHVVGRRLQLLVDLVAAGRLDPGVGYEASWEELDAALDALEHRRFAGKAVLAVR
jgi:NADPH:quinone reductase-like Zn-dependent oxidoreductase